MTLSFHILAVHHILLVSAENSLCGMWNWHSKLALQTVVVEGWSLRFQTKK